MSLRPLVSSNGSEMPISRATDSQLEGDVAVDPVLEVGRVVPAAPVVVLVHEVLDDLAHDLGRLLREADDARRALLEPACASWVSGTRSRRARARDGLDSRFAMKPDPSAAERGRMKRCSAGENCSARAA